MTRVSAAVLRTPRQVHGGEGDDGGDGERALPRRRGVGAEGEGHRRRSWRSCRRRTPTRRGTPRTARAARGRRRRCRPTRGRRRRAAAEEVALQYATAAATARPMSSPDPAAAAAGPMAANTPAPIIDPSPMMTASPRPSRRASRLGTSTLAARHRRRRRSRRRRRLEQLDEVARRVDGEDLRAAGTGHDLVAERARPPR